LFFWDVFFTSSGVPESLSLSRNNVVRLGSAGMARHF